MENKKCDWFWSNYRNGMDWIKQHEVAYWKSQALSYRHENEQLLSTLHNIYVPQSPAQVDLSVRSVRRTTTTSTRKHRKRKRNAAAQHLGFVDVSDYEVSDEFVDFLQISMKHQIDKKKEKEFQNAQLSAFLPPQDIMELRQKEMIELYGEGSAKILGMETAMTLAYERYVDQKNPKYWPELPLNQNPN